MPSAFVACSRRWRSTRRSHPRRRPGSALCSQRRRETSVSEIHPDPDFPPGMKLGRANIVVRTCVETVGADIVMSVRTRLVLAFLVLSVVPLSAVTLYSYTSSVRAFRAVVASESDRMAMELQQRLDTVTADIGRQVDRLWERRAAATAEEGR